MRNPRPLVKVYALAVAAASNARAVVERMTSTVPGLIFLAVVRGDLITPEAMLRARIRTAVNYVSGLLMNQSGRAWRVGGSGYRPSLRHASVEALASLGRMEAVSADKFRAAVSDVLARVDDTTAERVIQDMCRQLGRQGIVVVKDSAGREYDATDWVYRTVDNAVAEAGRRGVLGAWASQGIEVVKIICERSACAKCAAWRDRRVSITASTRTRFTLAQAISLGLFHPSCRCHMLAQPGVAA